MKRYILFVLLLCVNLLHAQEDAWVYFTDKPQAALYLSDPLQMLSQKALDRRQAHSVVLDEKDVPVHEPYISQIEDAAGITVMAKSKWLNAVHVRGTAGDITALAALSFVDNVDFADNSLDGTGRMAAPKQHKPVNKVQDMTQAFQYGQAANQIQMLNGHLLHQQDYTGEGMTIAVLDAGFPGVNTTQPFQRLQDNSQVLGGYNFVARSDNFYTGGSHGTLVLSTMAAYAEGQIVGTAPDAFYYLFVTEDVASENPLEESLWVEAAEMADSLGAEIINTSLGYFNYDNPAYNYTYEDIDGETAFITRGANVAFSRGMFLVNSAGNTATTPNPHITVPADAFNTLTVGAVTDTEQYAPFSSIGPTYDMRVKPDVMAQGALTAIVNSEGTVTTANGTSASSPVVAGLVACLWQALPDMDNAELLQLIKQSADRYSNPNPQFGYGIPDFNLALALGMRNYQANYLTLYPNPSAGIVSVTLHQDTKLATVIVFNSLGQEVLNANISSERPSLTIETLAAGIYLYKIYAGTEVKSGKLIRQ